MRLNDEQIREQEDKFYRRVLDGVDKNLPNGTTLLGVNRYGGVFRFPNHSRIEFIPHYEKDKRDEFIKATTSYHVKEFIKQIGVDVTDEIIVKLEEYIKKI